MADLFFVLVHRLADRFGSDDLRRRRLIAMLRGALTSLGNRIIGVAIAFVSVPLTIGYLGTERYGAWITIGAILSWLSLTDFGLGLGLANAVTSDASRDRPDLVRMHLSNFIFLMVLVTTGVALVATIMWPLVDWSQVFGVRSPDVLTEVRHAAVAAFAIFALRLPLSIADRIYMAYQEGHIGNRWNTVGSLVGLASLLIVTRTRGGLPWLVFAVFGTGLVIELANILWLFLSHRRELQPHLRHVDRRGFRQVTAIGGQFFLISIMSLVTFQSDALVIAHFRGAASVPTYSVTYTLFNYATLGQTLLFPYMWTAYNEAITRGDITWVRRAFNLFVFGGLAGTTLLVVGLLVIGRAFIGWWAGAPVVPTPTLILLMGAWVMINAFTNPIACLLAAASNLRFQLIYSGMATVANLIGSIYLVQRVGVSGVIGATVLSYLIFVCGPTFIDARLLLKRLDRRTTGEGDAASMGASS